MNALKIKAVIDLDSILEIDETTKDIVKIIYYRR